MDIDVLARIVAELREFREMAEKRLYLIEEKLAGLPPASSAQASADNGARKGGKPADVAADPDAKS